MHGYAGNYAFHRTAVLLIKPTKQFVISWIQCISVKFPVVYPDYREICRDIYFVDNPKTIQKSDRSVGKVISSDISIRRVKLPPAS